MGKTSSAVKNRYNNKAYDRITIMPKKGSKARYKAYAESQGKSLTALIVELLEREIEENGGGKSRLSTADSNTLESCGDADPTELPNNSTAHKAE